MEQEVQKIEVPSDAVEKNPMETEADSSTAISGDTSHSMEISSSQNTNPAVINEAPSISENIPSTTITHHTPSHPLQPQHYGSPGLKNPKELVITAEQREARNKSLPKGYVYIPELPHDKPFTPAPVAPLSQKRERKKLVDLDDAEEPYEPPVEVSVKKPGKGKPGRPKKSDLLYAQPAAPIAPAVPLAHVEAEIPAPIESVGPTDTSLLVTPEKVTISLRGAPKGTKKKTPASTGRKKKHDSAYDIYESDDDSPPVKRPRSVGRGRPSVEGRPKRATRAESFLDPLLIECKKILLSIMKQKMAALFSRPVDPVLDSAPNYFTIIKHPMDFSTIMNNLEGEYTSHEEFAEDMRLVFGNARTYNPPGHFVHQSAIELAKLFESKYAALPIHKVETPAPVYTTPKTNRSHPPHAHVVHAAASPPPPSAPPPLVPHSPPATAAPVVAAASPVVVPAVSPVAVSQPPPHPVVAAPPVITAPPVAAAVAAPVVPAAPVYIPPPPSYQNPAAAPPRPQISVETSMLKAEMESTITALKDSMKKLTDEISKMRKEKAASNAPPKPAAPPRGRPMPVPKKPVETSRVREMSFEEKQNLSENINLLPPENLGKVVQIIQQSMPHLAQNENEEVEIDIDVLDTATLRKLEKYVKTCLTRSQKRQQRGASSKIEQAELAAQLTNKSLQQVNRQIQELDSKMPGKKAPNGPLTRSGQQAANGGASGAKEEEIDIENNSSDSDSSSSSSSSSSDSSSSEDEVLNSTNNNNNNSNNNNNNKPAPQPVPSRPPLPPVSSSLTSSTNNVHSNGTSNGNHAASLNSNNNNNVLTSSTNNNNSNSNHAPANDHKEAVSGSAAPLSQLKADFASLNTSQNGVNSNSSNNNTNNNVNKINEPAVPAILKPVPKKEVELKNADAWGNFSQASSTASNLLPTENNGSSSTTSSTEPKKDSAAWLQFMNLKHQTELKEKQRAEQEEQDRRDRELEKRKLEEQKHREAQEQAEFQKKQEEAELAKKEQQMQILRAQAKAQREEEYKAKQQSLLEQADLRNTLQEMEHSSGMLGLIKMASSENGAPPSNP